MMLVSGVVAKAVDEHPRRYIKPTVELTVREYKKDSDVFEVVSNIEPEAGPFYVSPEAFKEGVGFKGTVQEFQRKIERESGAVFSVIKNIPLLRLDELEVRKKKNLSRKK